MGLSPGGGVMRGMEGRPEALADWLNAQNVANMLWAAGPHTVQYRTLVFSTWTRLKTHFMYKYHLLNTHLK